MNASALDALAQAIDKFIYTEPKPSEFFRFSLIGQCPAAQVGMRAGLKPTNPFDARVKVKLLHGQVLGKKYQELLEKEGFLLPGSVEREVHYTSYKGHLDGLTSLPCGETIVELKTADDNALKREMPEHYIWQGLGYALAAKVDNLLLVQIGKSQGLRREQLFHLTQEWRQKIETHIAGMELIWRKYQETKVLPDHVHSFKWENGSCLFIGWFGNEAQQRSQELAEWLDNS